MPSITATHLLLHRTAETSYYVTGTENIVKYLVTKLQQNVDLQGRKISFDRLYRVGRK